MGDRGGSDKAVTARMNAVWRYNGRTATESCDHSMLSKLNIRPVVLYGADVWTLGRKKERLLCHRNFMRMLRWKWCDTKEQRKERQHYERFGSGRQNNESEASKVALIWTTSGMT